MTEKEKQFYEREEWERKIKPILEALAPAAPNWFTSQFPVPKSTEYQNKEEWDNAILKNEEKIFWSWHKHYSEHIIRNL